MIKILFKTSLLIVFLSLFSCSLLEPYETKKVRIVDLQGKSHGVKTRVPALNAQILRSQGRVVNDGDFNSYSQTSRQSDDAFAFNGAVASESDKAIKNKYAAADYDAASVELVSQNTQLSQISAAPKPTVIKEADYSKVNAGASNDDEPVEIEYDLSDIKDTRNAPTAPSKMNESNSSLSNKTFVLKKYKAPESSSSALSKKPSKASYAAPKAATKIVESRAERGLSGTFVQTGAFSSMKNAEKSVVSMRQFGKAQVEESSYKGQKIFRVLLGSFASTSEANQTVRKVKSAGYDAIIVRK